VTKAWLEIKEANQEKIEAIAEHYKWVLRAEAMHLLAALQGWASSDLHRVPKGGM
jgi:hypothetical protein